MSNARLHALMILAGPERLAGLSSWIGPSLALQRKAAGAVGDVAQVAQQRALVAFLDFAVEACAVADRGRGSW